MVKKIQDMINFKVNNSPNAPLWNNYKLILNGKPLKNDLWESKAIRIIGDWIKSRDRKLKSFAKLSDSHRIDDSVRGGNHT